MAEVKRFPDTSEWYTPARAYQEEVNWMLEGDHEKVFREFLLSRIKQYEVGSIIEWGCGSGILAMHLQGHVKTYLGVDANETFLGMARTRCPNLTFCNGDVRVYEDWDFNEGLPVDLSMAFRFMKNFSLEEWTAILKRILDAGRFGSFDVQLFDRDMDKGTDYHDILVTPQSLDLAVLEAGHEEVDRFVTKEWDMDGSRVRNVCLWTRKRE